MKFNEKNFFRIVTCFFLIIMFLWLLPDVTTVFQEERLEFQRIEVLENTVVPDWVDVQLVDIGTSRRAVKLNEIK